MRTVEAAMQRLPAPRADLRGTRGRASVRGMAYMEALANARMGLSISRSDTVYLYASDRMSQFLGNGLPTFVSRTPSFQALFPAAQVAYYAGLANPGANPAFFSPPH